MLARKGPSRVAELSDVARRNRTVAMVSNADRTSISCTCWKARKMVSMIVCVFEKMGYHLSCSSLGGVPVRETTLHLDGVLQASRQAESSVGLRVLFSSHRCHWHSAIEGSVCCFEFR